MTHEIMCIDECGQEMLLFQGTEGECHAQMDTVHVDYPECRQFRMQLNATMVAQESARRRMNDEDYQDDYEGEDDEQ